MRDMSIDVTPSRKQYVRMLYFLIIHSTIDDDKAWAEEQLGKLEVSQFLVGRLEAVV
jgi:hypothetical protein